MTRLKDRFGWALTVLVALGFALRLNLVVAARSADSGQGRHPGQEKKSHSNEDEQGEGNEGRGKGHGRRAYRFEAHERDIITGYYTNPSRGLPPGLAKRGGNLPPGLEKQLLRNGPLPPGLQKRLEPLPFELERRLPPLLPGCGCSRGALAFGGSLRDCESELQSTLEDWILLGLRLGHPLPVLGDIDLNKVPARETVDAV
jgi:uncharacterized protein UPF0150